MTREKAGLSLSYTPWDDIETFLQVSNELRTGTQPISATFGYPFENGATQIIEPIHYNTLDVTSVLRYKEDDLQANLTYSGSFFRNSIDSRPGRIRASHRFRPVSYIPAGGSPQPASEQQFQHA